MGLNILFGLQNLSYIFLSHSVSFRTTFTWNSRKSFLLCLQVVSFYLRKKEVTCDVLGQLCSKRDTARDYGIQNSKNMKTPTEEVVSLPCYVLYKKQILFLLYKKDSSL